MGRGDLNDEASGGQGFTPGPHHPSQTLAVFAELSTARKRQYPMGGIMLPMGPTDMVVKGAAERSEAASLLDLNRTSGTALSARCPRAGWVTLTDYAGRQVALPTNCKTWRCLSCRERLKNLFKMRVVSGCFGSAHSWLITYTYKVEGARLEDVTFAKKDWKEFWRRWNRAEPRVEWLRVSEVTKKGMLHHHVVMVSETRMRSRCYGREFGVAGFLRRFDTCPCLSHRASRIWKEVTGDSYIVHAMGVVSPAGVGSYLAKYMMKDFGGRHVDPMRARRWSSSRGWPGRGRLRLRKTVRKEWVVVNFQSGAPREGDLFGDEEDLVRSGPRWLVDMMAKWERKAAMTSFRRFMDGHTVGSPKVL